MAATSKKAKKKTSKKVAARKKVAKKSAAKKTAKKAAKKPAAKRSRSAGTTAAKKKAAKKTAKKSTKKTASKKKAGAKTAGKKAKKTTGKKTGTAKKRQSTSAGARGEEPSLQTAHSVIPGIAPYKPRKGEAYMNEPQRDHFREILLAWRSQLVSDITRTISSMQDESFNHPDPTDRATQETDMSLELRSRDRERKLIKKIDETIQRIDEDDYGFCDNCGVEIGIARLEARPTATLCIDCKTLDEIRERQMV